MALTKKEEIILQLARFKNECFDEFNMPYGLTQDGIGIALGISRAHASIELKKLIEAHCVTWQHAHIKNGPVKRRVYMLTSTGIQEIEPIKEKMEREGILMESIFFDGTTRIAKADASIEMAYRKVLAAAELLSAMTDERKPNTHLAMELLFDAIKNLAFRGNE